MFAQRTAACLSLHALPFDPFFDTFRVELVLAKVQDSHLWIFFEIFKADAARIRLGNLLINRFCCKLSQDSIYILLWRRSVGHVGNKILSNKVLQKRQTPFNHLLSLQIDIRYLVISIRLLINLRAFLQSLLIITLSSIA